MSRAALVVVSILTVLGGTVPASAASTLRLGIVTDGPVARDMLSPEFILSEARAVLGAELVIESPDGKRLNGGWTREGIRAALDRLLADPQVDVVLTLGVLASYEAAHRERLPKPVIAPFVIDPVLQGYPLREGRSGRRNFVYIASFQGVADELRLLHRVTRFKHVAALVDRLPLEAMPELYVKARQLAAELKVHATLVPVAEAVDEALATLPQDADAIYVAPLLRMTDADMKDLAQKLIERRLPSFSTAGTRELEQGFLLSVSGGRNQDSRLARRIALNLQRIAGGEDAGQIEVGFEVDQRLAINMRTARAIGFSPRWEDLTDAEQLFAEEPAGLPALSLLAAMQAALEANPSLQADRLATDIAAEDVRDSRSALLPRLDAAATSTRIVPARWCRPKRRMPRVSSCSR